MNELINVKINENQEPIISGRELHEFLGVDTPYRKWFPRMVEYGFMENVDYTPDIFVHPQNNQETTDHLLNLDMAKEIAMIQRTEKGKQARQYFIRIEKEYNSPEKLMARALQVANQELKTLRLDNQVKDQQIAELKPKATYYDLVLQCSDLLSMTQIAKDYGMSAKGMNKKLHDLGVQFNQSGVWFLYSRYQDKGYTQTKTQNYNKPDGTQGVSTHMYWTQKGRLFLYALLKNYNTLPMVEREEVA